MSERKIDVDNPLWEQIRTKGTLDVETCKQNCPFATKPGTKKGRDRNAVRCKITGNTMNLGNVCESLTR